MQLNTLQKSHRHQADFQFRQGLAQADPFTTTEGQQGLLERPIQMTLRPEDLQVRLVRSGSRCN